MRRSKALLVWAIIITAISTIYITMVLIGYYDGKWYEGLILMPLAILFFILYFIPRKKGPHTGTIIEE